MFKKIHLIFAFSLFSNAFGQNQGLDVIIRDFQASDYGFEEFDTDKGSSGQCAGSNPNSPNSYATPRNQICVSGNSYIWCSEGGTPLEYGEYQESGTCRRGTRGFKQGPDMEPNCSGGAWQNKIYVTRDMVQNKLDYSQCYNDEYKEAMKGTEPEYLKGRYCARPLPTENSPCYGRDIAKWYTDGSHTKTVEDLMELEYIGGSIYRIKYDYNTFFNWNGNGLDNGYFPLDKYDDKTYGKQSLNVWCPRTRNGDWSDDANKNNCNEWDRAASNGVGPLDPNAAAKTSLKNKLHNYSFTMAGSAEFKYEKGANDIFEFVGDDDMWIFIDGELVVDLGGTHLAAPAKINIKSYGEDKKWEDQSKHSINFYYADRQTDGSNLMLRMAITNLSPPRFGAPRILKAETIQKQDGTSETTIYVNNKIDSLWKFIGSGQFPILIKKQGSTDLFAYKLDKIIAGPENMGSQGYAYIITGQVCKNRNECGGNLILNSGDSLSFNVKNGQDVTDGGFSDPNGLGLPDESWYIKSTNKTPATTKAWGINTTDLPPIDFKPDVPDKTPIKPPFFIAGGDGSVGWYDGGGKFPSITQVWDPKTGTMVPISSVSEAGLNNSDVHGFGTVGKQIPMQRTGELILTVFPSTTNASAYKEWLDNKEKQKLFGLPPTANDDPNIWWGLADPSKEADNGGYQFVKNGFPNESSTKGNIKIAPTRCTTIFDEKGEPRINCLNFSLVAKQPFQLAVTVYDQLGNFVTQYRETLTEQEFRNVVQAPNYISGTVNSNGKSIGCELPTPSNYGAPTTLTTNGQINVNVNIYPFSAAGRRFGNGVYIVKIDRVDLPFRDGEKDPNTKNGYSCASAGGGNSTRISPSFIRYHADQKFGWMRSDSK
ncbi:MAG: fibro-slime domain-containing protein [Fibromonadales bacterium]|nr:fibro-slime domain-containing protein [Fibromonadales bacterium]